MKRKISLLSAAAVVLVSISGMLSAGAEGVEREYYPSQLFNESTQEMWNLAKVNAMSATVYSAYTGADNDVIIDAEDLDQGISTELDFVPQGEGNQIRLSTSGSKQWPFIYFWDDTAQGGRLPHGDLFPGVFVSAYEGIRLHVQTENNPYEKLTVYIGFMNQGYWPGESTGFYAYDIAIEGGELSGDIHIPFSSFINKAGTAFTPGSSINFIAFQYNQSGLYQSDIYVSNLALYREKTEQLPAEDGRGVILEPLSDYEFVESVLFAEASQKMWDQSKTAGLSPTAKITDAGWIPAAGKNAVRLHTTAEKPWPEIYFWNEGSDGGRVAQGRLFGDTDAGDYEGIRIWLKSGSGDSYSKLTIYLGKMFKGYWPTEETGFYGYTLVIPEDGLDGYVNIPFSYFVNNKGEALDVDTINFIAFKYPEKDLRETDLYVSDLQMYRKRTGGSDSGLLPVLGQILRSKPFIIAAGVSLLTMCAILVLQARKKKCRKE